MAAPSPRLSPRPHGIKRLLGQSRTAVLGGDGQEHAGVVVAKVSSGEAGDDI